MTYVTAYLVAVLVLRRQRVVCILLLPLIAADCAANMLILRNSWRNTVSGEAWAQRDSPAWGWAWRAIDLAFGKNHCQQQNEREQRWGSVWSAWWRELRGLPL